MSSSNKLRRVLVCGLVICFFIPAIIRAEGGVLLNTDPLPDPEAKSTYRLLAPLPGLTVLYDPDLCLEKQKSNPSMICDVGGFLVYALKILIGIAAVVLVIRLVMEGYRYMTSDVPFMKMKAKGSFMSSLMGLLLALSSYIILNTINPMLVSNTINIDKVSIEIDADTDITPITQDNVSTIPRGTVATCTEGIVVLRTFGVCKRIADNLKQLLNDARIAGLNIGGGGFRTREHQISLRIAHCGNGTYNIFQKPSSECRPPTARPGHSNHESGLAFDFTCDGQTIRSRDNKCYLWLQRYASNYGLKNLSSEPWHWSVNGR